MSDSSMVAEAAEQSEPTMEEILASIRKIIATEGAPEQPAEARPDDDIIELTDVIEEEPAPIEPVIEEVAAAAPPPVEPAPMEAAPVEETPVEQTPPAEPAADEQNLVSAASSALTATSFSQLAEHLQNQRVNLAPHIEVGNGKQTLENLVADIMRPLLKEWLDNNLPATVERMVQSEIDRISRRNGD